MTEKSSPIYELFGYLWSVDTYSAEKGCLWTRSGNLIGSAANQIHITLLVEGN